MEQKPIGLIVGIVAAILGFVLMAEFMPDMTTFASTNSTQNALIIPTLSPPIATRQPTTIPTFAPPPTATNAPIIPTAVPTFRSTIPQEEIAPEADGPTMTSEEAGACFSMYSRNRNLTEPNACFPEWYPVDGAPRAHDVYWCATRGDRVVWLPVQFYDGRASSPVQPHTRPDGCQ